jgi:hypothetical protein
VLFRTWVTLSAPIARLPFASPEAKHKFLLLITPHYYHPFRPAAFSNKDEFNKQHANQPRSDRARHRKHFSARERKEETILTETALPANLLTEQPPRVGGHTPANVPFMGFSKRTRGWVQGLKRVDEDRTYIQGLNDREGEDKDGWFVVRSKKFGYQLQNKKWCVDLLKRLVEAANVCLLLFVRYFAGLGLTLDCSGSQFAGPLGHDGRHPRRHFVLHDPVHAREATTGRIEAVLEGHPVRMGPVGQSQGYGSVGPVVEGSGQGGGGG